MKFLWRSSYSSSTCASFLRWKLRCGAQCCTSSTSSSSTVAPGFHVTVPIFYVNSDPHIGHLYSALLADAMFRWRLLRAGHSPQTSAAAGSSSFEDIANFHFSAGTDEHGKKIEEAASARGASTVQQHCDAVSQRFAQLFRHFGISNTQFVRTSEARHVQAVTHFWKKLEDGGHIQPDTYEGWYSTADECFYADSEVMDGTLADGAYGKVSIETHASVFKISEPNYTFNLAPFYDRIRRWISRPGVLTPIHLRGHVLEHICNPSLAKLSVSRPTSRCPWGIPVPGDPTQTIYVWLDALVNYLTAVGYPAGNGTELRSWPPTIQILGKDIFRFHAIFWPAFLLAANLPLPQRLFVHAHWLVDKRKMSKSVGNVVCPFQAAELLSVDGLRYFLLKQNPIEDGNFSMEKAVTVINSYLVNDLGNLLQRAINPKLNPGQQYPGGFGGVEIFDEIAADDGAAAAGETARRLVNELRTLPDRLVDHFDRLEVHRALELLVDVVQLANLFFQQQKPWKSCAVGRREHVDSVLFLAYETVRLAAIFLQPVTPQFADKLLSILGIQTTERRLEMASFMAMAAGEQGSTSKKPRSLGGRNEQQQIFPRIIYDKKDV